MRLPGVHIVSIDESLQPKISPTRWRPRLTHRARSCRWSDRVALECVAAWCRVSRVCVQGGACRRRVPARGRGPAKRRQPDQPNNPDARDDGRRDNDTRQTREASSNHGVRSACVRACLSLAAIRSAQSETFFEARPPPVTVARGDRRLACSQCPFGLASSLFGVWLVARRSSFVVVDLSLRPLLLLLLLLTPSADSAAARPATSSTG